MILATSVDHMSGLMVDLAEGKDGKNLTCRCGVVSRHAETSDYYQHSSHQVKIMALSHIRCGFYKLRPRLKSIVCGRTTTMLFLSRPGLTQGVE